MQQVHNEEYDTATAVKVLSHAVVAWLSEGSGRRAIFGLIALCFIDLYKYANCTERAKICMSMFTYVYSYGRP